MWSLLRGCHQSRLYPHVWCLSQSGRNSQGTAGNVLPPRSLSSTLAAPVYTGPWGSTRTKAGASSLLACAGPWSSTTLPKQVPGPLKSKAGKCPLPARSDRACGAHLYHSSPQRSHEADSFAPEVMANPKPVNIAKGGRRKQA